MRSCIQVTFISTYFLSSCFESIFELEKQEWYMLYLPSRNLTSI